MTGISIDKAKDEIDVDYKTYFIFYNFTTLYFMFYI
jgi:hypothetical protein